jgi:dUTP pyrophosphatase
MITTKFKKLDPNTPTPKYAQKGDAGIDLVAMSVTHTEDYIEYGLGLALEIADGYAGFLFPRSSLSKYDLSLCNHVGIADSKFRGEIKARFKVTKKDNPKIYNVGDRVCQLVVMPFPFNNMEEVEELSSTERGTGGWGSTGK